MQRRPGSDPDLQDFTGGGGRWGMKNLIDDGISLKGGRMIGNADR